MLPGSVFMRALSDGDVESAAQGGSFVVVDAFLNLLFGHLAIGDPVVVIGGDGQLLGAVIDGKEHPASGSKTGYGEQAIDGVCQGKAGRF
ncbi:hypothetical protein WT83_32045 [Burkholderia territorii]|uniref:Uncharacterized protein n=1 Tax=Burkholderia territorii TaxID=1503055 RepID=A0A108E337_9BURK|nr:hypothetical protein WT83_32045 [Burkholderia territorii]